ESPHLPRVLAAFAKHLTGPVAPAADFFLDLGGNSLVAAQVISDLRRDPATASLTVRDLYETRTAGALARRVRVATSSAPARAPVADTTPRVSPHAFWGAAGQVGFLAVALLAVVNAAWAVAFRLVPAAVGALGITLFVLLLPTFLLAAALAWTVIAAAL